MANGQFFNYSMTNCGDLGWIADKGGYRYQTNHPETGKRFPAMPENIRAQAIALAAEIGNTNFYPESCLINFYHNGEKLGMHQDNTEKNLSAPIISISLGDTAIFSLGGKKKQDTAKDYIIQSGDAIILSGESRNCFHALKKIIPNTNNLLKSGGRINLTIRQVN